MTWSDSVEHSFIDWSKLIQEGSVGLAEAVLDGETGLLFEPGNVQALADCLETLLENPDLATEYGRRGRERCERELNFDVQRERFLAAVGRHLKA